MFKQFKRDKKIRNKYIGFNEFEGFVIIKEYTVSNHNKRTMYNWNVYYNGELIGFDKVFVNAMQMAIDYKEVL